MTQQSSLSRYKLNYLDLPGHNPKAIAQRVRRKREARLKKAS